MVGAPERHSTKSYQPGIRYLTVTCGTGLRHRPTLQLVLQTAGQARSPFRAMGRLRDLAPYFVNLSHHLKPLVQADISNYGCFVLLGVPLFGVALQGTRDRNLLLTAGCQPPFRPCSTSGWKHQPCCLPAAQQALNRGGQGHGQLREARKAGLRDTTGGAGSHPSSHTQSTVPTSPDTASPRSRPGSPDPPHCLRIYPGKGRA